eukprot:1677897-Amphidinium_carterae.2
MSKDGKTGTQAHAKVSTHVVTAVAHYCSETVIFAEQVPVVNKLHKQSLWIGQGCSKVSSYAGSGSGGRDTST